MKPEKIPIKCDVTNLFMFSCLIKNNIIRPNGTPEATPAATGLNTSATRTKVPTTIPPRKKLDANLPIVFLTSKFRNRSLKSPKNDIWFMTYMLI